MGIRKLTSNKASPIAFSLRVARRIDMIKAKRPAKKAMKEQLKIVT